jgi:hypothetical protein
LTLSLQQQHVVKAAYVALTYPLRVIISRRNWGSLSTAMSW